MVALSTALLETLVLLIVVPAVAGPFIARWAGNVSKRRGSSPSTVRGVRVLITVLWASMVAEGLSLAFGPIPFFSTLTFTAVGSIALTLALQTTLQNIVAGFLLHRRGFLLIQDEVEFSSAKGHVVSMGLVTTVLRLEDGRLAFVSNSNLLAGPLINRTASARLQGDY